MDADFESRTPALSILDVVPIGAGSTGSEALRDSLELARMADRLGFVRYWFAEHHGMPSIASSAPEILIARMAAATERIRVGSGGIMLQNHVPLKAAEAFHTLEALFPGRIDLGIGRAPGTDPTTSQALRPFDPARFVEQLTELTGLSRGQLPPEHPFNRVRVIPSDVALPPIWLLGSSGVSARLAGELGMGYGFASHFSPAPPKPALEAYRAAFRASPKFPRPHAILAVSVICAETDAEAERLATSHDLMWVRITRSEFRPVPTPEEALAYPWTEAERAVAKQHRQLVLIGSAERVREQLLAAATHAGADEVMITTMVHGRAPRLRSYELLADVFELSDSAA
jgi:luciferase family oxidoreductase group 1